MPRPTPFAKKRKVISDECRDYEIQLTKIPHLCRTCGQSDRDQFQWVVSHTGKRIWQEKHICKSCRVAKRSNYAPTSRDRKKDAHLKALYGVSLEQYWEMLAAQGGRCLGCGALEADRPEGSRKWPVDHNHVTGAVRGILCSPCNRALGLVRDDTATLLRLVDYLEGMR